MDFMAVKFYFLGNFTVLDTGVENSSLESNAIMHSRLTEIRCLIFYFVDF